MALTIDMAWTIVISSDRIRLAGIYITFPDIGVGACGKNTTTQSFSSCSSRYPICRASSILTKTGGGARIFDVCKAFGHAFYNPIVRETTEEPRLSDQRVRRATGCCSGRRCLQAKEINTNTTTDRTVTVPTPACRPNDRDENCAKWVQQFALPVAMRTT